MIEQSIVLIQIIFIDVIMAADNAIIIGLIAANFAPKNLLRKHGPKKSIKLAATRPATSDFVQVGPAHVEPLSITKLTLSARLK